MYTLKKNINTNISVTFCFFVDFSVLLSSIITIIRVNVHIHNDIMLSVRVDVVLTVPNGGGGAVLGGHDNGCCASG